MECKCKRVERSKDGKEWICQYRTKKCVYDSPDYERCLKEHWGKHKNGLYWIENPTNRPLMYNEEKYNLQNDLFLLPIYSTVLSVLASILTAIIVTLLLTK